MLRGLPSLFVLALGACGADAPDELAAVIDTHWEGVDARGVTVAVHRDGITRSYARGFADFEAGREMAPSDRLRVGSITKTFTAAVILQLADQGVLSLDDTIDTWVPGFALGPEITVRRALMHTTGLFNFTDDLEFLDQVAVPAPPQQVVAWALEHPAAFDPPGTSFNYSNTNYVLLGMVIEAATGTTYAAEVRARLLEPLALDNTFVEDQEDAPGLVAGYLINAPPPPYDASWSFGTGSVVSTGDDLCRWADALYRGSVVPASLLELMTTESQPPDGTITDYGMATYLYTKGGRDVVGHTGSTMGFNAELFIDQTNGDCIAVLSNDFFGAPEVVGDPLWETITE